jgi:hypothetical protein
MATKDQARPLLEVYPQAFINAKGDIEIPGVKNNGQPLVIGGYSSDRQSIEEVWGIHNPYGTPTNPTNPTNPAAPQVTAQLLGRDSATGEFLVLLSLSAPTTLNRYVLATYVMGPVPSLLTGPLPAGTSLASRLLRLPASTLGQTLCLLDAGGAPMPLQIIEAKADENDRFSLITTADPAVPQSVLRTLLNWDCEIAPATLELYLKPGRAALVNGSRALILPQDAQVGDIYAIFIDPATTTSRVVFTPNTGGIDGASSKRYLPGAAIVYRCVEVQVNGGGTRKGLQTMMETSPRTVHFRGEFSSLAFYVVGDLAVYQGGLYLRLVEGNDAAFDPSKWVGGDAGASAPSPVVGIVGGVETGYADLTAAFAAKPEAIHLHAAIEVSTSLGGQFAGKLFGNGHTITIASGGVLRFSRYVSFYQLTTEGAGTLKIIGAGSPSGGTVPPAEECAQLTDCLFSAPFELDAATSYQGLALRGNTVVENLTAGGGPVYVYDLAQVSQPLPAGFTVYDLRPGTAVATGQVEVQLSSDSTNRVARIRLTKLRTLLSATAVASQNAQGYYLQVNTYRNNAWVAGPSRTTVADVQADLAALDPADYAAGAELEIQVVPIAAGSNASMVLQLAGAESVSFLAATRAARRTNLNAPPAGYTGITSVGDYEETDAAHITLVGGWASGAGAVHSSGACVVRAANTNDTVVIHFWLTNACRIQFVGYTDPSLGVLNLNLDGSYYDSADQSANSSSYQVYYTSGIIAPGEHVLTISGNPAKTMLWDCFRLLPA